MLLFDRRWQVRGWQNNIAPAHGIPGPVRTCPVCGCTLANSEMGANSHLRMHIRRGEIAREDEQRLRRDLLHRPYRSNAEHDTRQEKR